MSSIYKGFTPEEYNEHFSHFLISSWSYSKVASFARNEKAFEMQHIYGLYARKSATTIAGNAYHEAVEYYFTQKKEGKEIDLVEMEASAFAYLDNVNAADWKIQKTTPTVDACKQEATKLTTALLKNFYGERALYEENMAEILDVEVYGDEFVTVNGVDIPLPCHYKIDLVIRTHEGKVVVVDHKSKRSFTAEEEIALSIGIQAITYVIGYEAKTGIQVDEVWFVENKYSNNKDKSPQLVKLPVEINNNTRRLYEALLYEPLKRMVEAVSNPDYIYLINDSDNFVDMVELYDFWARTMIAEVGVDDFNIEESKKELVGKRLKKIRDSSLNVISPTVIRRFKENAEKFIKYDLSNKDMASEQKIEHVLRSFNVIAKVAHVCEGYSSNTYLLEVSAGVKVATIFNYKLDIANALNVPTVRFSTSMVMYKGQSYLGIECSKKRTKDLIYNEGDRQGFKIPLGKDNYDNIIFWDLNNNSTPHALICGATGSGKSVFIRSTISYVMDTDFDEVYIFDPKYEFTDMHDHMRVFVYNEIEDIEEQMANLVREMEQLVRERRRKRILVVFDEFADAVANSRKGKELEVLEDEKEGDVVVKTKKQLKSLEENLRILAQKGRSSGFRIMAATQRASVKVITGDAKVNFPVQICFRVPKATDSMVVLDEAGAEGLTGSGDGLIKSPDYNDVVRFQAYFKA